jgi:cell division septal protein FtsQ
MELDAYLSQKHRKRKKKKAYFFFGFLFLIAYAVLTSAFWFFLHAPFFRIDNIVVQGNDTVASGDVVTLLQSSVLRNGDSVLNNNSGMKALFGLQNMLIWPGSLPTSDLALIPQLADLSISKDYFSHTITANVTERTPAGIWCLEPTGNEQCYWFDDEGTVFEKAFDTEGSLMVAVHDYSKSSLGLGDKILPAEFVSNLISILNVIKSSGLNPQEVALNDIGLEEIDVTTYNGPEVYFSLRFPADEDLAVLQNLMAKPNFGKLQYVDFRVDNRAYYK